MKKSFAKLISEKVKELRIRRYRKRFFSRKKAIVGGAILAGMAAAPKIARETYEIYREAGVVDQKSFEDWRFDKFAAGVIRREGYYASAVKIDQETTWGIIQSSLERFLKKHKKEEYAKGFPREVKDLKLKQALVIFRKDYFDFYKIAKIKNESVAEMIFDISCNHTPKTMEEFVDNGLEKVFAKPKYDEKNWAGKIDLINGLSNEELKAFYDGTAQARVDFFNREEYIKKYGGLKKRATYFVDKFKPEKKNIDFFAAKKSMKEKT